MINTPIINNNPPPNSTNNYPFRIATLNVQGLNSTIKQKQIIEMCELDHISIIGLSETKVSHSQSRFIYKSTNNYTTYFDNDSSSPMGSGVGFIISNDYTKFVHRHNGYKGRVYHVDMFMKGHVKLRIIQVYLHASISNNRKNIENIHNYIFNLLNSARKEQYHTILMGDFNVQYEDYKNDYKRKCTFHWSYNIFHQVKHNYNLVDGIKLYNDITQSNRQETFLPKQSSSSPTRIDFIWISRSLVMESIACSSFVPQFFNTDHKALFMSFYTNDLFKKHSEATLRQHKIKKRVYTYDHMNDQKWDNFIKAIDERHDRIGWELSSMNIQTTADLNKYWALIKNAIMNAAFHTIDNHLTTTQ